MDQSKYPRNPPPLDFNSYFEVNDITLTKPEDFIEQPAEIARFITLIDKVILKLENLPDSDEDEPTAINEESLVTNNELSGTIIVKQEAGTCQESGLIEVKKEKEPEKEEFVTVTKENESEVGGLIPVVGGPCSDLPCIISSPSVDSQTSSELSYSRSSSSKCKSRKNSLDSKHRKSPETQLRRSRELHHRRSTDSHCRRSSFSGHRRSSDLQHSRSPDTSHRSLDWYNRKSPFLHHKKSSESGHRKSPDPYHRKSPDLHHRRSLNWYNRRSPDSRYRRSYNSWHRKRRASRHKSPDAHHRSPDFPLRKSPELFHKKNPDSQSRTGDTESQKRFAKEISKEYISESVETAVKSTNVGAEDFGNSKTVIGGLKPSKNPTLSSLSESKKVLKVTHNAISFKKEVCAEEEDDLISKVRGDPRSLVSYDDLLTNSGVESPFSSLNMKKELKKKPEDFKVGDYYGSGPGAYYCSVCQLSLNSKLTFEAHIRGKKHAKVLKSQAVHEIAKSSITQSHSSIPKNSPLFAVPPVEVGRRRVSIPETSKIQSVVNKHQKHPLPGLDHVIEILRDNETSYYCELCDSPCFSSSIMPHLIGFKHQLFCLKKIDSRYYDSIKDLPKKVIEKEVMSKLFLHQERYGKGIIRVFKDITDLDSKTNMKLLSGEDPTSGRGPCNSLQQTVEKEGIPGTSKGSSLIENYLNTSKGDLHCTICDAHMNNRSVWKAHIKGKRHLKNTRKIPGDVSSKSNVSKAPANYPCVLQEQLKKEAGDKVIVGLDFIRETQGPNGELYNCFVCSSCCTNLDIIDHLLTIKHRIKYLEKMNADGYENGIVTISKMDISENYFRENLIIGECQKMEQKYGRGTVEVYHNKIR